MVSTKRVAAGGSEIGGSGGGMKAMCVVKFADEINGTSAFGLKSRCCVYRQRTGCGNRFRTATGGRVTG